MTKDPLKNAINVIIEDLGHLSKNVARGYGAIQPTVRTSKPSLGDSEAQDAGEVKEITPVRVSRAFLKAKAEDQINESDIDKKIMLRIIENIVSEVVTGTGSEAPTTQTAVIDSPDDSMDSGSEYSVDVNQLSVKERKLYDDLIGPLENHNLCVAMVVNATAESNLHYNIAGDCGDYGIKHKKKAINTTDKGYCCSFGLWQYNICRGLGIKLLKANGVNVKTATSDEKMAVLSSYDKQVTFMIAHVKKKAPNYRDEKTINWWIDWFVKKVEKPKDAAESSRKRQARGQAIASRIGAKSNKKPVT